jgi:hypothetical protein
MPIPNSAEAIAATEKVRDYLLNLEHPDGGSKAVWFHSLGYARDEWRELAADLLAIARGCREFVTERTPFGIKFIARGKVGRPNHRGWHRLPLRLPVLREQQEVAATASFLG